jgi:chromosome segregation ATPase
MVDRFRSSLVVFLERAGLILDEVSDEVKRTRIWLQTEQKLRLTHEIKKRNRDLEMLEQALFTARLSNLKNAKTGQQMQISKKRRELRELETKMRAVSMWLRDFDSKVEVEAMKVEKLRHLIDSDMRKAVTFLSEAIRLLEDYSSDLGKPIDPAP